MDAWNSRKAGKMNDLAREASLSPGLMCHPGVGGVADKENTIDCG